MIDANVASAKFASWVKVAITVDSRGAKSCAIEYLARQYVQGCVHIEYVAHIAGGGIIKVRSASPTCHPSTGLYCAV